MTWKKVPIQTSQGQVNGIAPEIISASRATDIPAFYADWFFHRLEAGYVKWLNPFSGKAQFISLANARAVVFWSKNPKPIMPHLHVLDERGLGYYLHFTLNDYEDEGLEPGVPSLTSRIDTFRSLADRLGPERVIWRFDPLIQTDSIDTARLLAKIARIGERLSGYTTKLVFSLADVAIYKKVQNNLKRCGVAHREFSTTDVQELAAGIARLCQGWNMAARTCAQDIDLSAHGIGRNKCVDDDLILKVTGNHEGILRLFGMDRQEQLSLLADGDRAARLKDPGQRKACRCVISKDIGQYNTCPHGCVYCYANTSRAVVAANRKRFTPQGESIVPA